MRKAVVVRLFGVRARVRLVVVFVDAIFMPPSISVIRIGSKYKEVMFVGTTGHCSDAAHQALWERGSGQ
jgi:hypothetical protein